ncbi:MAG: hypothetical protein P4L16_07630 [Chlamydiales bacterium]|nr:hypothetical protein [Chlamydiales bacterium]
MDISDLVSNFWSEITTDYNAIAEKKCKSDTEYYRRLTDIALRVLGGGVMLFSVYSFTAAILAGSASILGVAALALLFTTGHDLASIAHNDHEALQTTKKPPEDQNVITFVKDVRNSVSISNWNKTEDGTPWILRDTWLASTACNFIHNNSAAAPNLKN